MRTAYKLLATSLLLITVLVVSPDISAHGDEAHETKGSEKTSTSSEQPSSSNYSFVTPEGGSMSVLTRRAIQLFDEADSSLSLTPAQAAYVEATLVQELGNRYLEIGERFTVPKDRLAALAKQSLALDSSTAAAWQEYAGNIDFAVNQIAPENQPVAPAEGKKQSSSHENETEPSNDMDEKDSPSYSMRTSWIVFLTILAVSTGVYVAQLRRRSAEPVVAAKPTRKKASAKKTATTSRKRKK